jgi:hypothetical protein
VNHVSCDSEPFSPSIGDVRHAHAPIYIDRGLGTKAEHICLESDEHVVPHDQLPTVRFGPKFRFDLPAGEIEFTFSTDHRLTVCSRGPRGPVRRYVIDLRFVDPAAAVGRRFAWPWWQVATVLAVLGALGLWLPAPLPEPRWQQAAVYAATGLVTLAVCAGVVGLLRARDTVILRSTHGAARLAEIAGRPGSARAASSFIVELSRRVEAARTRLAQSKQQFLRDEMREHHRLWSEGVLSDAVYEASKRRILLAHDDGCAPAPK